MYFIVIISAGPRFEGKYLSGVSHFLEKLAFMVGNFDKKKVFFLNSIRNI